MLEIRYIRHSCFTVETDSHFLIFDYYKGVFPAFPEGKRTVVFSSHNHGDHFNIEIFKYTHDVKDVRYVLSRDIKHKYSKKFLLDKGVAQEQYENILFIGAHEEADVAGLHVETLESTDEGVAFIVCADGKRIYHAGDLNLWLWEDDTPEEVKFMNEKYASELARIASYRFDAAFVPVDPRLGANKFFGIDRFMRTVYADIAYPMHFWHTQSVVNALISDDISQPYRERLATLKDYKQ